MAEPIEFLIVQDLQAALRQISPAAGYHYDVASMAVKLDPNHKIEDFIDPNGPRPFLILEVGKERREYAPASEVRVVLPLTVHWVGESSPAEDENRMQMFYRACADIERAVAKDPSRGGRAVDTRITGRTFDTAVDGAQVWALVDLQVSLWRTYGEPDA